MFLLLLLLMQIFYFLEDYSKSESDKRTNFRETSSGNSPPAGDNVGHSDRFKRRLSFDLIGGSGFLLGGKGKSQHHQREQGTSSKCVDTASTDDSCSRTSSQQISPPSLDSDTGATGRIINDVEMEDQEENFDSTCSSPEQETVRPKKSSLTCTRGPHVQELFERGTEVSLSDPTTMPLIDESTTILSVETSEIDNSDHTGLPNNSKAKDI